MPVGGVDEKASKEVNIEDIIRESTVIKCFMNKQKIIRETKINVFKIIHRPILTFDCEA